MKEKRKNHSSTKPKKPKKERKVDLLHLGMLILALLFVLYYLAMGISSGFGTSILYIWLFFAGCLLILDSLRMAWKCGKIRIPKWIRTSFCILLSVCFVFFLFVEVCIFTGFRSDAPESADYLIVLGANVRGENPSPALELRIDAAYDYLAENPDTVCIAAGGKGNGEIISEAECIRRELVARGIDGDRILLEERSVKTSENLTFSQELISDKNAEIVIVTNNFHVFRSKALARKCEFIHVYGIAADFPFWALPHYMVREFISVVVDTLYGNTAF
ncbi:MAG: YdcF family protein [Eubacteriales bacterium]